MQNGIVSCGLMSGTSADGIDLSLIRTNGLDLEIVISDGLSNDGTWEKLAEFKKRKPNYTTTYDRQITK